MATAPSSQTLHDTQPQPPPHPQLDLHLPTESDSEYQIFLKLIAHRAPMSDVPPDAEAERLRRLFSVMRHSKKFRKLMAQDANRKWDDDHQDDGGNAKDAKEEEGKGLRPLIQRDSGTMDLFAGLDEESLVALAASANELPDDMRQIHQTINQQRISTSDSTVRKPHRPRVSFSAGSG